MLSWSAILQRVKEELSLPFQELEKTDEEIVDYLRRNAVKKYSTYFPQKWRLTLDCSDPTIYVPHRTSEYYLVEPDDREIFNVTEFIPQFGNNLLLGHPYLGAWTYEELESWHLQTMRANNLKLWSNFNYNTEFITPNRLRITPRFNGTATIEYERAHDPELSTIIADHYDLFTDLCYGMFGMMIGRIRKKYAPVQTPFGEIQINADDIFNDAKEVYDKCMDKMERGSLPNVIFDHG